MMDLVKFFKIPFDTDKISDDNLKKFSNDHIQRIVANNDSGQYDEMRDNTITAYTDYFGAITDEYTAIAIRQSLTITTDNIIADFKASISQKEGLIKSIWGVKAPEYQEFFPYGVNEYHQASKANIETLMNNMADAASTHQAELGVDFVNLFTDYKDKYKISREAQLEKKGVISEDKTSTSEKRDVLEIQLYINLLTLAIEFPGNPDRGMDFFDQQIVRKKKRKIKTGILSGDVKDEATGEGVEGVFVEIVDLGLKKKTDSDNAYIFEDVKVGTYTVKVSKDGYESRTINDIAIESDMETVMNIPADVPAKTFAGEIKTKIK